MPHQRRKLARLFALVIPLSACSEKDDAKCTQGLETAKLAVNLRDFNSVGQWRDHAKKYCRDGAQIDALDQTIAEKRLEAASPPVKKPDPRPFIDWVAQTNGKLPAVNKTECYGKGDPDAGWCEAYAKGALTSDQGFAVKWWKADSTMLQFESMSPYPGNAELRCEDIGAQAIRRWSDGKTETGKPLLMSHCKFVQGVLGRNAWHAWLKNVEAGAFIRIMNEAFLSQNKRFMEVLETQGTTL